MLLYLFFICGDSPDPSSIVIFSLQQWVYVKPCTPILLVLSCAYAHDFTRWFPMELVMLSIKNKVKIIKMEIHISLTHLDNKANNKRVNWKIKRCRGHSILLMGRRNLGYFSFSFFVKGAQPLKEESWIPWLELSGFQMSTSKRYFSSHREIIC